jgi:hypothetical protein
MSLTDKTFLREDLEFSTRLPSDKFLENRQLEAEIELRAWITDSEYDAAVATLEQTDPAPDPADLRKAKIYRQAESRLVLYFGLPTLNIKVSDQGIILAAAPQNVEAATFRAATPKEIAAMKKACWNDAWKLVSKFKTKKSGVLPVVPQ